MQIVVERVRIDILKPILYKRTFKIFYKYIFIRYWNLRVTQCILLQCAAFYARLYRQGNSPVTILCASLEREGEFFHLFNSFSYCRWNNRLNFKQYYKYYESCLRYIRRDKRINGFAIRLYITWFYVYFIRVYNVLKPNEIKHFSNRLYREIIRD